MRIGLIRHGETDWNAQSRLQGATDIPLNDRGIEQAEDAARLLRGHDWSRVVCSPLTRTRHTAEIIASELALPGPVVVPNLVERSFGDLEGELVYREDGSRMPLDHPSVEPVDTVTSRTLDALREIAGDYSDHQVLAIAHGSVIRLTMNILLGWKAPHISNLALSVIEPQPQLESGFRVHSVNGYPLADQTGVR